MISSHVLCPLRNLGPRGALRTAGPAHMPGQCNLNCPAVHDTAVEPLAAKNIKNRASAASRTLSKFCRI